MHFSTKGGDQSSSSRWTTSVAKCNLLIGRPAEEAGLLGHVGVPMHTASRCATALVTMRWLTVSSYGHDQAEKDTSSANSPKIYISPPWLAYRRRCANTSSKRTPLATPRQALLWAPSSESFHRRDATLQVWVSKIRYSTCGRQIGNQSQRLDDLAILVIPTQRSTTLSRVLTRSTDQDARTNNSKIFKRANYPSTQITAVFGSNELPLLRDTPTCKGKLTSFTAVYREPIQPACGQHRARRRADRLSGLVSQVREKTRNQTCRRKHARPA